MGKDREIKIKSHYLKKLQEITNYLSVQYLIERNVMEQ